MQIAAMYVDIGAAEACLAGGAELQLIQGLARVPGTADERVRTDARPQEAALEPQATQHLHHVGTEDDAGTDAGKSRRLLVDGDGKALALQEGGARQSAEAGTDNGDAVAALQSFTP